MARRSILFVDDDVLTQWIMTEVLTTAGYDVVSACRGSQAITLIDKGCEFDLLLTDVDLPDSRRGLNLAEHWCRVLPGRPIIYTGLPGSLCQSRDHTVLEKPLSARRLLSILDFTLGSVDFMPLQAGEQGSLHVH